MKNAWKHTSEAGRSMVEMLGVLAIVGVLSVGGIAGYSKAMSKFRVGKIKDDIMSIVSNVRALWAAELDYQGLSAAFLAKNDMVPKDMDNGDTGVINVFGGAVTFTPDAAASKVFQIDIAGVPEFACKDLVLSDWGGDSSSGFLGIAAQADGAATGAVYGWEASAAIGGLDAVDNLVRTLNPAIADTICADETGNTVTMFFR